MKFIDLSYEISEEMPVYPGDINVSLVEDKNYIRDEYTSYILKTGLHAGTHLDSPMHLVESKKFISEYQIESFIGEGIIIDARGQKEIKFNNDYIDLLKQAEIVLIYTGFEEAYGSKKYYNEHPVISTELANEIIKNGVKMVGFDMPSPDHYPFNIHKILLGNNIFLLENLCNLKELLSFKEFKVIALPLKIKSEASLVRAIAVI